jgi:hypothetical protein
LRALASSRVSCCWPLAATAASVACRSVSAARSCRVSGMRELRCSCCGAAAGHLQQQHNSTGREGVEAYSIFNVEFDGGGSKTTTQTCLLGQRSFDTDKNSSRHCWA